MTYAATELSQDSGSPVELYEFVFGPNYFRYTSAPEPITFVSNTFAPQPIGRAAIDERQSALDRPLEIRTFRSLPILQLFQPKPPSSVVTLVIRRRHLLDGDAEFVVVWMGRVLNVTWEGNEAVLLCESDFSSTRRTGLRRSYQQACPHVLYGTGCNLAAATFATTVTAYSISGRAITVPGLIGQPDNYFAGGFVEYTNPTYNVPEYVAVRSSVGSTGVLNLALVPAGLLAPQPLIIYPGCDHTTATCQSKFNNLANFGGQPYIPTTNPFSGKPIF
jgi:uncharacterized phage protein (TIGR02218 family)